MEQDRNILVEESFDVKKFVQKLRSNWKLLVLSVSLALGIAIIKYNTSEFVYEASAYVLIKKEKPLIDLQNLPSLTSLDNQYSVKNEIEVLNSIKLTEKALSRLNFNIEYYSKGHFKREEIYNATPFLIIPDSSRFQPTDVLFTITFIDDSLFRLSVEGKNVQFLDLPSQKIIKELDSYNYLKTYKTSDLIISDDFAFQLELKNKNSLNGNTYCFRLRSKESLLREFREYTVNEIKNSTVLKISYQGKNIQKISDYLNTLCNVYIEKSIEKKQISATNSIRFIESQLLDISDSLKFSEDKLQNFQSSNKVMDMDYQSRQVFTSLEVLQNNKAELLAKQKYFSYLKDYLEKNNDGKNFVAPTTIGISEPLLNNMLNELIGLLTDRAELMYNVKKDNPYISSYEQKILSLKKSIFENVNNLIAATNLSIKETDKRISDLSDKAGKLPKTQRQLFGFERQFKLNDALYTFLLTKRSEIQISKAALLPDNELINEANYMDADLLSPKLKKNILLALLLGLGLPIIFILLKDYFSERVQGTEDIEKVTDNTILGHIVHNKINSMVPVLDDTKSLVAESFRSIRTNFQFLAPVDKKHTVLVTSSMMDEGKSFTSLNLAASFALSGKRTVLLYFDLRKPIRSIPFGLVNESGLSTYLSGNCDIEKIIHGTNNENLSVILPGPLPPNPTELIAGPSTSKLFSTLNQWFDYIVIDTPPVGMVADGLLLINFSDINIFLVRHNYTNKNIFSHLISTLKKKNINNFNIIINDLPLARNGYNYNYSYNYNYNYGYGYYNQEKPSLLKRILK